MPRGPGSAHNGGEAEEAREAEEAEEAEDEVVVVAPVTQRARRLAAIALACLFIAALAGGCAGKTVRPMEVTAYCSCQSCTEWERGRWKYLKLDFWNKYITKGPQRGQRYSGLTASGTRPREPQPGLFSLDTLTRPWMLPVRVVVPWWWLPRRGTVAADTRYYPFGTRLYIPGYGRGVVEDRGGAIKGPHRLDVYYRSHRRALHWGRQTVPVEIGR